MVSLLTFIAGTPGATFFEVDLKKTALLIAFLLVFPSIARSEDAPAATPQAGVPDIKYRIENPEYWKSYGADGIFLATSPARWDKYDWYTAAGVAAVTGGLYIFDQKIRNFAQENRSDTTNGIANVFTHGGEEAYLFPGLAVLYIYGNAYGEERPQRTALLSLESWFYSSALTIFLKEGLHRHRPYEGADYQWDGPSISNQADSFPSGHASTAWSIGTVIANEYNDSAIIPPLAYGVATMVGLSRINDNVHWASDVFFSSVTGYFIGTTIVERHDKPSGGGSGGKGPKITIIPIISSQGSWLYVDATF